MSVWDCLDVVGMVVFESVFACLQRSFIVCVEEWISSLEHVCFRRDCMRLDRG